MKGDRVLCEQGDGDLVAPGFPYCVECPEGLHAGSEEGNRYRDEIRRQK